MNFKISINGVQSPLVAIDDVTLDINYTAEEVIALLGAYKEFIPVILSAIEKGQINI